MASMDMSLSKLREIVKDRGSLVCCSPWGHKESDTTEQLNSNNFLVLRLLHGPLSHLYMTTGKPTALTIRTFVSKVISPLFTTLSRFVIAFLPRSKCLNFMAAVTICSDFGAQENKICHCSTFSPSICHAISDETECPVFLIWSFKPAFPLSSFTLIKRLFSSSSLSVIRVVSSAYLRLSIFLSAILIPACDSSSLAFHVVCSTYFK